MARTVEAVLASKSHVTPAMLTFMESLLAGDNDFDKLSTDTKAMVELVTKISVCFLIFFCFMRKVSAALHFVLH